MLRWIFAIHESIRLERENLELKQEVADLQRQLLLQIDSSRNREDALVDKIVGERMPSRQLLVPATEEHTPGAPNPAEIHLTDEEERLVNSRAKAYAEHYDRLGIKYDFEELCQAIRSNPDQFLSN